MFEVWLFTLRPPKTDTAATDAAAASLRPENIEKVETQSMVVGNKVHSLFQHPCSAYGSLRKQRIRNVGIDARQY
ncbi:MAG: hypothetical protein K2K99_00210, partial [Muribaculaceae bacterium]|nr:hypothetical protein [Muribaculaceae bacterium]